MSGALDMSMKQEAAFQGNADLVLWTECLCPKITC